MTQKATFLDRRRALEASFDGPIPKHRLAAPAPPRLPTAAAAVMRSIARRRRKLTAAESRQDAMLARLTRHLHWLVQNDRR